MPDYTPVYEAGDQLNKTASAGITGGQILEVTGDGTVGPAAVTSLKVVGVAATDYLSGQRVSMYGLFTEHETVVVGTTLVAGDPVKAGASGALAKWVTGTDAPGAQIGVCTLGAAAAAKARWIGLN